MKDYVNVKITGLNLLRLIDKLVEKNVCITGLKVKTNQVRFSIEEDKLPILDNVCKFTFPTQGDCSFDCLATLDIKDDNIILKYKIADEEKIITITMKEENIWKN